MKRFSKWSIGLMIVGLILFGFNRGMTDYTEPIVILSLLSFMVGSVLSFIAVIKHEEGTLKFLSLIFSFIFLFWITWFEPLQFIRIITWLKNVL
jgi:hypothetical protein